jgi:hypothetical protein
VKDEVKKFLTENNVKMHKKDQPGNLTVSHYMTLLQKLISILNYNLIRACFRLDADYDFVLDPNLRKRRMLKTNTRSS